MKIMKNSFLSLLAIAALAFLSSCEGPMGPVGPTGANGTNGTDGTNGADANETCKLCHMPTSVDLIGQQFEWSKHKEGEAAFEESGRVACAPCHESEGFKYVVANNTSAGFTLDAATNKYINNYQVPVTAAWGNISCYTCHNALHTTYGSADLALTTTAAVPMTMFGGTKTIDLPGNSNLCVKCHQPRPVTVNNGALPTGQPITYSDLAVVANLNNLFWDGTSASAGTGLVKPSFRTGGHYGAVSAVYAGIGAIEFAGGEPYINSTHTSVAACSDCHMAAIGGIADKPVGGGHTFNVNDNLTGCDVSGCHDGTPATLASAAGKAAYYTTPQANIVALLNQLGPLLTVTHSNGITYGLMHKDATETNLWLGHTKDNYDGYLNLVNVDNPGGEIPDLNFDLTNKQMGAILNFQFGLREFSLGIHNYKYTHALLSNTIEVLGGVPVN